MAVKKPANLALIRPAPDPDPLAPPPDLAEAGAALWRSVQQQYAITDAGGLALLRLACQSVDRAAECSAAIADDGVMVRGRTGMRSNPISGTSWRPERRPAGCWYALDWTSSRSVGLAGRQDRHGPGNAYHPAPDPPRSLRPSEPGAEMLSAHRRRPVQLPWRANGRERGACA